MTASGRYGQLTYTSFDGRGVGGWQIKDQQGLTEAEQDSLLSRIDPQLDTGVELPQFPSPDQIAQFPRRLVYGPQVAGSELAGNVDDGAAVAWWHHAPAGLDGSGRPGNVFTHVLLDRSALPPNGVVGVVAPGARPVDLWRSAGWLAPYGADAVRDAVLLPELPRPGQLVSAAQVVAFLLDHTHYRLGVLAVLLDACAAAARGGPSVVLAAQSTDTAAWWIASVTYLMSSASADRFGFSTLERPGSLPARLAQGLYLCCVPSIDYEVLSQQSRPFVLIGEDDAVEIGDLDGEPHVTAAGDRVAVTEWSVLAKVVLIDEATAAWALAQLDDIAGQVPDGGAGTVAEPGWPLAMVVARAAEHLSDAVPEAARVLIRHSPPTLDDAPELLVAARELIEGSLGPTVADVWEPLERATQTGRPLTAIGELLFVLYVSRAVQDSRWLGAPGGPPVPRVSSPLAFRDPERPAARVIAADLSAAIDLLRAAGNDNREAAGSLAALANFTVRLGILTAALLERLMDALDGSFIYLLFAPDAPQLVARLGQFSEQTQHEVIRPLVNQAMGLEQAPLGQRLAPSVLSWLYPHGASPELPQPKEPGELRLRGELAFQRVAEDPVHYQRERPLAVAAALAEDWDRGALAGFFAGPLWRVDELSWVESSFPGRLLLEHFGPAIKAAPSSGALDELCTALITSRRTAEAYAPYGPGDLIRSRQFPQRRWWRSQSRFSAELALVLSGGVHALRYQDVPFHPDALDQLHLAMVLAVTLGRQLPDVEKLIHAEDRPKGVVSGALWAMVGEGTRVQVYLDQLVVTALLGDPEFPEQQVCRPYHRWVHRLRVEVDGVRVPILQQCVALEVTARDDHLNQLIEQVREGLWVKLKGLDNPERAYKVAGRFAQSWLKPMFGERRNW